MGFPYIIQMARRIKGSRGQASPSVVYQIQADDRVHITPSRAVYRYDLIEVNDCQGSIASCISE
jgi:hypothetical protein